jgi:hypothetical protein
VFSSAGYYAQRDRSGAGYDDYESERSYREAKGRRLLDWVVERAARPLGALLEVGSGFGFTRQAAAERGWNSAGVELNPHAARAAERLYGMTTFVGTLEEALRERAISAGSWDVVLYAFVL